MVLVLCLLLVRVEDQLLVKVVVLLDLWEPVAVEVVQVILL